MGIFDRRKEPSRDDISARLSQYVTPAARPPEPEPPAPPEDATPEEEQPVYEAKPRSEPEERVASDTAYEEEYTAEEQPTPAPVVAAGGQPSGVAATPAAATASADAESSPSTSQVLGPATNEFSAVAVPATRSEGRAGAFFPPRLESLEDTGLTQSFVSDLVVRTLYQANELTGLAIAERVALPFQGIVGPILENLRHDQEIEVKSQRGIGDAGYLYAITEKGIRHARDSMDKLTYAGPAPVPLESYVAAVLAQTVRNVVVTQDNIREAFRDLIIDDSILDMVGPAVNSGSSMFLFGYPGNGKTSIAERITKLMGDYIFVPHAIEVDGSVIKLFDAVNHTPYEEPRAADGQPRRPDWDTRWVKIERPVVMVGGELTMASLDLLYNDAGKYYEAPLQMKANGGMFLIDDFGRQMVRPQDLLNRWIVPLEKRVDFLNLVTGKKISMPFEQLIVFSTNLDPKDLVDDAFLRRIKFKINVLDPDVDQFRSIFKLMCNRRSIAFDEDIFHYMLDTYYQPVSRPLRMCQPRDIIDQLIAIAKYKMSQPEMNRALIDRACETYFVNPAG